MILNTTGFSKDTSATMSIPGRTCPWRKTHQTVARFNLANWEESFRSPKLAASIIATNVAPPDCSCDNTTRVFRKNPRVTAGELSSVRCRCNSFANPSALQSFHDAQIPSQLGVIDFGERHRINSGARAGAGRNGRLLEQKRPDSFYALHWTGISCCRKAFGCSRGR